MEHIVIDGGSTDDSANTIKQYHHLCSVFEMIVYGFSLFLRENITIMGARSRLICSFQTSIISPCLLGIGERFRRSLRQNLQFFNEGELNKESNVNFLHVPFPINLFHFVLRTSDGIRFWNANRIKKNIPERLCLPGMMFFNLSQSSLRFLVAAAHPS